MVLIVVFKTISRQRRIRMRWVVVMGLTIPLYLIGYCVEVLFHPVPFGWKISLAGPLIVSCSYLENKLAGATWHEAESEGGIAHGKPHEGVWPPPPSRTL